MDHQNDAIQYAELVMGVKLLPFQKHILTQMLTHTRVYAVYPRRFEMVRVARAMEIIRGNKKWELDDSGDTFI
ncbi:hypothetical protein BSK59_15795 [Paenibacillus odorifer]|nr:hypothetical protein BSK59_15795 [Paenibacillus odorifer]